MNSKDTPPQIEPSEQEAKESHVVDLISLSEKESAILTSRIQASRGTIRIFVHPYYYEKMLERDSEARAMGEEVSFEGQDVITEGALQKLARIYEAIPRIVKLSAEQGPPVIFFEEEPAVGALAEKIEDMLSGCTADARIYVVPTFEDRATPRVVAKDDEQSMLVQDAMNWPLIIERLTSLGVSRIILSGAMLTIEKSEEVGARHHHCLGAARNELLRGFNVSLSELTFPHGRKEVRAAIEQVVGD
ncbi:hypothetical protein HY623_01085 [Candidatus Uhrbacteria bacterium]|nr:hypothetical protein [Candidatus Uhrbacteria bacterium]